MNLVSKLVLLRRLCAQSVKKRTRDPKISKTATGDALIANVTLDNGFGARIRCLDMKLVALRLSQHSWSDVEARRPPWESDALLG